MPLILLHDWLLINTYQLERYIEPFYYKSGITEKT